MATPVKSFADIVLDWEKLLAAYSAHAESLPALESTRLLLVDLRDKALELKRQQEVQISAKQRTTQETKGVVRSGSEAARRLRKYAAAVLGTDNELLVAFGVAPRRDRRSRRGEPPLPPVVEPPPPPVE